jgi:hypothetical protein
VDRKENKEILQKVRSNIFFSEVLTKMLKMLYFVHVMKAHQYLEKYIMLGIITGARKKGEPCMRWMDIKSVTGLTVNDLNQLVKDREK